MRDVGVAGSPESFPQGIPVGIDGAGVVASVPETSAAIEPPPEGFLLRFFFKSQRGMQLLTTAISSVYTGLWLGLLSRKQLHAIAEYYFRKERFYRTDEYNNSGLFQWEKDAIENYFGACRSLLLVAAGGGRELLALRRLGFEVDAFDAHPELVRYANGLLEREGMVPDVRLAPWDRIPEIEKIYEGAVVGWGCYMHIRGRERRIRFLRELRDRLRPGAPVLLSFYVTSEKARYHRWVGRVGRATAWILRRERVDVGDSLLPFYAHFFTRDRLEKEMNAAGFEPVSFETIEYGHAVARAAEAPPRERR